jgi:hypothetical protein
MLLAAAQPRTDSGGLITDGEGDARTGHGPFIGSGLSSLVSRLSSLVSRLSSLVSRLSSLVPFLGFEGIKS